MSEIEVVPAVEPSAPGAEPSAPGAEPSAPGVADTRFDDGSDRATALGSLPGTDPREAARTVVGELPGTPHLPELPARGVGADMLGRAAALLVDLAVEVRPSGYRVAARAGGDHRRAVELLARDVDALDEAVETAGARPARVKCQVAGPWTLAAGVELRSGHRLLTDRGAVAEFAASLAEGLRGHVDELRRRTGAPVLVQIDEPTLPAVLAGSLPTPSGYGTVRTVPGAEARAALEELVAAVHAAGAEVALHCCHPRPPLALLGAVGADAVALDLLAVGVDEVTVLDALGELWDATTLWLGVVPSTDPLVELPYRRAPLDAASPGPSGPDPELADLARPALDLADRLGFARSRLHERAVVTPTCGLAGATPAWARRAMTRSVELARAFADPPSSW